ncbi:spermine/spermidine synthase [Paenibacillus sp. MSJ-34]|uniref:spermine/spermidine synthase domain-containing protein n=1 Tax=Paenibacillus sp. MSJ-34 TaxID=2841529 RepID=UPI001C123EA3|nr:spermine/spermidine synthase [Paenibacillus sp. MSJ-34]MBU5443213.1 spermine/spermidine synthase [Paenibacillus sp. MSJ-34]
MYAYTNGDRIVTIERCATPRGELQLQRRGTGEYEIVSNGTFLMATYNGESEKRLVKSALDAVGKTDCSVLIGGLGVGYSLEAAVNDPRVRRATVVEIEDKIIEWNRSHLAPFSGNAAGHSKARIVHADLIRWMSRTEDTFDAICLDIDNGPDWTVFQENDHLYGDEGLASLGRLLNPQGAVSFWSASSSPVFAERLERHFITVDMQTVERSDNVHPDVVYIAKR